MPVTHAKVSAKSDGGDATLVRPSDWNASHAGIFDATVPDDVLPGGPSATGAADVSARRDHDHHGSGGLAAIVAASAGINTTETQVVGFTIPANLMVAGKTFRLTAHGVCTTTVANVATIRCRIGATTLTGNIAATITATGTTTGTAAPFEIDILVTVRTAGAGGTVIGNGRLSGGTESGALQAWSRAVNLSATVATVAVDTTGARIIELTCVTAAVTTTMTFHDAAIDLVKT